MTRARRTLLVNPSPLYDERSSARPPDVLPGPLSLLSHLMAEGVPAEFVDLHLEHPVPRGDVDDELYLRTCADTVMGRDFAILGISCASSYQYLTACDLAARVRAADGEVLIVVGGAHATAAPDDFLGPDSPFDIVVRGEGELALTAIAVEGPERVRPPRVVDGAPLPLERPRVDFEGYPYWRRGLPMLMFPLSRGCPWHCAFCARAHRGRWHAYPVLEALALARTMLAAGSTVVGFSDACFGVNRSWRRAFLAGLAELEPQVPLYTECRADVLDDVDARLLAALPVRIDVGVETLSPRLAALMEKGVDGARHVRRCLELLDALSREGVLTQANLLLNHPGEDEASLESTLTWARGLAVRHPRGTVFPTANIYAHLPGNSIAQDLPRWERETALVVNHPRWWHERGPQGRLARDVRTGVTQQVVDASMKELWAIRRDVVLGMPPRALLTWRLVSGPVGAQTAPP